MIKVAIAGIAGRMGRSIASLLSGEEDIKIVGATERQGHTVVGKDIGVVLGSGELNVFVSDRIEEAASSADVIVDFTTPASTLTNARYASRSGKAMVIGTTGFSDEEIKEIEELAKNFACVISPNMSVGVNVMFDIVGRVARLLGEDFDVEILEIHHRHKVDSPSGTALKLGQVLAEALGREFRDVVRLQRSGNIGRRGKEEIGIQSIRGGDVIGEHTVLFLGSGERIEITHKASSRENFSRGAIRALRWVVGKPPGIYSMKDVLGL
jgi:4-hydroxy-tetrahydrodipicolinate reductase